MIVEFNIVDPFHKKEIPPLNIVEISETEDGYYVIGRFDKLPENIDESNLKGIWFEDAVEEILKRKYPIVIRMQRGPWTYGWNVFYELFYKHVVKGDLDEAFLKLYELLWDFDHHPFLENHIWRINTASLALRMLRRSLYARRLIEHLGKDIFEETINNLEKIKETLPKLFPQDFRNVPPSPPDFVCFEDKAIFVECKCGKHPHKGKELTKRIREWFESFNKRVIFSRKHVEVKMAKLKRVEVYRGYVNIGQGEVTIEIRKEEYNAGDFL